MAAPIFIVGAPRSGTTLLRNLLRSHPRLSFPEESHFIPLFYRTYGDPANDREALALGAAILKLQFVRDWNLGLDAQIFAGLRSYADVVSRLFECWAEKEHKPRWGDKTPQNVLHIPTLVGLFPECKILHIIRDGRDVALSWMRIGFGPKNVYTAAQAWKRYVSAGIQAGKDLPAGKGLPDNYREVRFELLLLRTEPILEEICTFIGEQFDPRMLAPTPLPEPATRRYNLKVAAGDQFQAVMRRQTELDRSHREGWKSNMSKRQLATFESVAGELLTELNYPIAAVPRRIGPIERGCWLGHQLWLSLLWRLGSRNKIRWLATDLQIRWAGLIGSLKRKRTRSE